MIRRMLWARLMARRRREAAEAATVDLETEQFQPVLEAGRRQVTAIPGKIAATPDSGVEAPEGVGVEAGHQELALGDEDALDLAQNLVRVRLKFENMRQDDERPGAESSQRSKPGFDIRCSWLDSPGMFDVSFIPAFKDNYIWLLTRSKRAVVVDPGDARLVAARLEAEGLVLESILVTHHHADHQGGVAELVARWQPAVFAPENESITGCNRPLAGGETIEVLGQAVSVLAVPGHTRGHLAYIVPGALFCGDTLFGAGCGRLFEGTAAQMADSLGRLAVLADDTKVYCAHEYTEMNLRFAMAVEPDNPALVERMRRVEAQRGAGLPSVPSTLGEEKATNPFLRCREPAVIAAALAHGAVDPGATAVFAALRSWRNGF
ncbi:hypothetical protein B566_EDAN003445 [Ephemera danica]|nr:hypothetical protein B566_EDAN003445 [Ephemera danica]